MEKKSHHTDETLWSYCYDDFGSPSLEHYAYTENLNPSIHLLIELRRLQLTLHFHYQPRTACLYHLSV